MKIRKDFVTNSSSSSFLLAFKDKKDAYSSACEAFLKVKYQEKQESNCDNLNNEFYSYDFDEGACALDNIINAMEHGKITVEEAINKYIDSISWYPTKHNIRKKYWENEIDYPRESYNDFNEKYGALIDNELKEELAKKEVEVRQWLSDKQYITCVEFEDHWPEGKAYEVCDAIDKNNSQKL